MVLLLYAVLVLLVVLSVTCLHFFSKYVAEPFRNARPNSNVRKWASWFMVAAFYFAVCLFVDYLYNSVQLSMYYWTPTVCDGCPDWVYQHNICERYYVPESGGQQKNPLVYDLNYTSLPHNYRKAKWDDFVAEPPQKSCTCRAHIKASTSAYSQQYFTNDGRFGMYLYLSSCSFVQDDVKSGKDPQSQAILDHEQMHLDIRMLCYSIKLHNAARIFLANKIKYQELYAKQRAEGNPNPTAIHPMDAEYQSYVNTMDEKCSALSRRLDEEGSTIYPSIAKKWRDFLDEKMETYTNLEEIFDFHASTWLRH